MCLIDTCANTQREHRRPATAIDPRRLAIESLAALLDQLADVLLGLSDAQYSIRPVGVITSSIGAHLRHCLDHVRALLIQPNGLLNYDHRDRGTPIESDRRAALAQVAALADALRALDTSRLEDPVRVPVTLNADGDTAVFDSTLGREITFVFSHTIHHNALISAMVKILGADVPHQFGYAPATLAAARS